MGTWQLIGGQGRVGGTALRLGRMVVCAVVIAAGLSVANAREVRALPILTCDNYIQDSHWALDEKSREVLVVTPTGCGFAWAHLHVTDAFDEAARKAGGVINYARLHDQFECHSFFATFKPKWDLEPWRPDVGYWSTVAARCNPDPTGPVYGVGQPGRGVPRSIGARFVHALVDAQGVPAMGQPQNAVHWWGPGCIQDYRGGGRGRSAIMAPRCAGAAYFVSDYFWSYYAGTYHGSASTVLGYPTRDPYRPGRGWAQDFNGGRAGPNSLMRGDGRRDVHDVQGAIRAEYLAMGGGRSALGFPVTNQYQWCGIVRQDFIGGSIGWDSARGARLLGANACGGPVNRYATVSYDRVAAGAPHHGYFNNAWQGFAAQSNTLTYIGALAGNPTLTPGSTTSTTMTIRLCSAQPDVNGSCSGQLAQVAPRIVNYGITGADIGDVAVTPGREYWIVWYQPAAANSTTWVTYWWAGGSSISQSDQMVGRVVGYNR
jgi:hypothetical protein